MTLLADYGTTLFSFRAPYKRPTINCLAVQLQAKVFSDAFVITIFHVLTLLLYRISFMLILGLISNIYSQNCYCLLIQINNYWSHASSTLFLVKR